MTHELTISFDERFLCRGWGISCACGWKAAAESEAEAQRLAEHHRERMEGK